ncbi:MAG: tRNA glutamyl-Q(34) synthetase GluQRS [Desulfuromonadales bacterium]|nr:tRNA glutamyl-Q(34) synthetase GluQRS [Desulfuromonadales bacterium]
MTSARDPHPTTVGRFAPSPTGPLHWGSLVAAVGSYCLARSGGGRWLVRIDDLDTPRVVAGAADEILRTLERLGMEWDGEIVWQSRRTGTYAAAVEELRAQGMVFACGCSRKEILASAPQASEEGPVYPGTCRAGLPPGHVERALRLRVTSSPVVFVDGVFGRCVQNLAAEVGDFVMRRADGIFSYQLACVVDDAAAGINQVVRGADLLGSTPRQIYLYSCLGLTVPAYLHLPLALAVNGEKLSKRHGDVADLALHSGGALIRDTLLFLGQEPPPELTGASAAEVLAWGCANFQISAIPALARVWGVPTESAS